MARSPTCFDCGYSADSESDDWELAEHPTLGTLTQCPDCGSTDVVTQP